MSTAALYRAAARWGTPYGRPPTEADRAKMVDLLRRAADALEEDSFPCEPYTVAIVLLGQRDGAMFTTGLTRTQADLCAGVLEEDLRIAIAQRAGQSPRRRNVVAQEVAFRFTRHQKARAYREAHPFECKRQPAGHRHPCGARFRTERGLRMHQARNRYCKGDD